MSRRAVQPLNPRAARAADDAIAPDTDGRRLTCYRDDARYRRRWMDAYVANGGEVEEVSDSTSCGRRHDPPPHTDPTPCGVTPCPCADAVITSETVVDTDPAHRGGRRSELEGIGVDIVLPRDRRRVAVGEEVRLTYSRGNARWTVTEGHDIGRVQGAPGIGGGPAPGGSTADGSTVSFLAGAVAGWVTVRAEGDGCHRDIRLQVVAPETLTCVRCSGLVHHADQPDVGVYMNKRIGPNDVCFVNVSMRELDARAVASGIWSPTNGASHSPSGTVIRGTDCVKHTGGTFFPVADLVYSGGDVDLVGFRFGSPGSFHFDIPVVYGIHDDEPSLTAAFSPVRQQFDTESEPGWDAIMLPAMSTARKGGESVLCHSNMPTSNIGPDDEVLPWHQCDA